MLKPVEILINKSMCVIQILYQLWFMTPRMDPGSGLVVTHTICLPKPLNV